MVTTEKMAASQSTIARTVVLSVALLNQVLTVMGKNPLPWSDDQVYQGVTVILTVCASAWSWWKNNSFSLAAIKADLYKNSLKGGE